MVFVKISQTKEAIDQQEIDLSGGGKNNEIQAEIKKLKEDLASLREEQKSIAKNITTLETEIANRKRWKKDKVDRYNEKIKLLSFDTDIALLDDVIDADKKLTAKREAIKTQNDIQKTAKNLLKTEHSGLYKNFLSSFHSDKYTKLDKEGRHLYETKQLLYNVISLNYYSFFEGELEITNHKQLLKEINKKL